MCQTFPILQLTGEVLQLVGFAQLSSGLQGAFPQPPMDPIPSSSGLPSLGERGEVLGREVAGKW